MKTLRLGKRHTSNPKLFSQGASTHTRGVFREEELCSCPSCPVCPAGTPRQEFPGCPLNPRLVPAGEGGPGSTLHRGGDGAGRVGAPGAAWAQARRCVCARTRRAVWV